MPFQPETETFTPDVPEQAPTNTGDDKPATRRGSAKNNS